MTLRIEHPLGLPPPEHWEGLASIPVAELVAWLNSATAQKPKRAGKRNANGGYRADIGKSFRSSMEANWARFLIYLGYREWSEQGEPPSDGRWWRYEGRRWDFPQKTANGKYISDFEVWPGFIEPSRRWEVHETKGWLDGDSKTKLNRMARYHPEVPIELVTSQVFRQYTRHAKAHIKGWE